MSQGWKNNSKGVGNNRPDSRHRVGINEEKYRIGWYLQIKHDKICIYEMNPEHFKLKFRESRHFLEGLGPSCSL